MVLSCVALWNRACIFLFFFFFGEYFERANYSKSFSRLRRSWLFGTSVRVGHVETAHAELTPFFVNNSKARLAAGSHHLSHVLCAEATDQAGFRVDVGVALHHPFPYSLGDDLLIHRSLQAVAVEQLSQLVLVLVHGVSVIQDGVEIKQTVASPGEALAHVDRRRRRAVANLADAPRVFQVLVDLGDVRPLLRLVLERSSEVSQQSGGEPSESRRNLGGASLEPALEGRVVRVSDRVGALPWRVAGQADEQDDAELPAVRAPFARVSLILDDLVDLGRLKRHPGAADLVHQSALASRAAKVA